MCVDTELINLLRIVINDIDAARYDDNKLSQVLVASMYYVINDADLTGYTVNATTITITPTPASDIAVTDLLILKANCMLDTWLTREAVRKSGLTFQEFSSRVDTKGLADAHLKLLSIGACKAYNDAVFDYAYGDGTFGRVILTPFRSFYSSTFSSPCR